MVSISWAGLKKSQLAYYSIHISELCFKFANEICLASVPAAVVSTPTSLFHRRPANSGSRTYPYTVGYIRRPRTFHASTSILTTSRRSTLSLPGRSSPPNACLSIRPA
jgi:hypothetical protein